MPRDSFCVAGAVFAEVGVWLFVAGAAFGDILGDSRSAKCCIFQYKIVSEIGRVRSPKRRVRDDDFILGLSSDYPRIVFLLGEAIHGVSAEVLNLQISWQAQYLLRFEVDFACSAHSKWRFICDADQSWDAFCVTGAVFGEVGVWLFVAGAALGDILGDSRSTKCCIFQYKIVFKVGRVRSPKRRVRDDDFMLGSCSDHARIILESSLYWRKQFREFPMQSWTWRFRGRRSIWWGYRVTLLAPRIVNDVSYVTRINHEIHFAWQAQYLVKLECYFSWQAQHLVTFWEIAGARNVVFFHTKCVSKVGRGRSPRRRVRDDDFMLGSCSDHGRIILESSLYWRKQFREFPMQSWT